MYFLIVSPLATSWVCWLAAGAAPAAGAAAALRGVKSFSPTSFMKLNRLIAFLLGQADVSMANWNCPDDPAASLCARALSHAVFSPRIAPPTPVRRRTQC